VTDVLPKFQHHSSWLSNHDIPDHKALDEFRVSREGMGGYVFPLLNTLPAPYMVTIFPTPKNRTEYKKMAEHVAAPDTRLAYVDTDKLVVVSSECKVLDELGLSVLTTDHDSKTIKRAKTIVRPFRLHTKRRELRVMVIEGDKELDGAGIVSPEVFMEAVLGLQTGKWNPVQRAMGIRYMERQRIHNARFIGNLVDATTGLPLNAFGKGNFVVAPCPEGVDIVTTWDNLKHEVIGTKWAWALFEPQSSKDAWEDRQSFVNQTFLMSEPEARERMIDGRTKALDDLKRGKIMSSVVDLVRAEFHKDFAWEADRLETEMRWNANALALHGVKYTVSPWMTKRLSEGWVQTLSVNDPRKMRLKIPCAIRAQVVSQSLVNLAGVDMEVNPGDMRWCADLKVLVANDEDWVNVIIPTHGGCDLDDFFVGRWRTDGDERKIVITRSPNTRGEYSIWNYVEGDWYPTYTNRKGEEVIFPELTRKRRPKQILQAIEDGDVTYMDLPSKLAPPARGEVRNYTRRDCLLDLRATMQIEGGYGQYELAVCAYNSLSPTHVDPIQIRSEDAVDAFTQGGTVEDRAFILADRKRIIEKIKATGKEVDVTLASRLGDRDVPSTEDGPISRVKKIIATQVGIYKNDVDEFCDTLDMPPWLKEIGENPLTGFATLVLKKSRRAMFFADQASEGMSHEKRVEMIRHAQEKVWAPFFAKYTDRAQRARFVMAFWYSTRIVATSSGRFTDQAVFGTNLFPHLLDALVFYGIARRPFVDDRGRVLREAWVDYKGDKQWQAWCKSCKGEFNFGFDGLVQYWRKDQTCKECRDA